MLLRVSYLKQCQNRITDIHTDIQYTQKPNVHKVTDNLLFSGHTLSSGYTKTVFYRASLK